MIPKPGQRWRWIHNGPSIKSDLIVEIMPSTSSYIAGKCLQIINSNDPGDKIGSTQSIIPLSFAKDDSLDVIKSNYSTLVYLPGQDSSQ